MSSVQTRHSNALPTASQTDVGNRQESGRVVEAKGEGERSGFRGGAACVLYALIRLCVGDAINFRCDRIAVIGVLFFFGGEPAGGGAFLGPAMGLLTVSSERRDIFLTFGGLRCRLGSGGVYHSFSSLSW
jgi:hypothetical protein